jgi:hypothetical protein
MISKGIEKVVGNALARALSLFGMINHIRDTPFIHVAPRQIKDLNPEVSFSVV